MQLVLERCPIRPWRLDDAESLAKREQPKSLARAMRSFPHPYTIQDAHEFLQRAINEQPTAKFCIEVNGRAVRGKGIRPGEDVHRHAAGLGYWLGGDFWRRGIMSEAVAAFNDFCFDNFLLRRIYAEALRTI